MSKMWMVMIIINTRSRYVLSMCFAKLKLSYLPINMLYDFLKLAATRTEWSEMVTGMCWGGMMGMSWEKHWSLKWRARGSEDDQRRHGRCKWRRTAGVLVSRRRMSWIERDRELERLLLEWGKYSHPLYEAKPRSKLDDDDEGPVFVSA